jgi:hypothetical protein
MDDKQFECFIHGGILEDPFQCLNCQIVFCKECINNYYGNLCPNCQKEKNVIQHIDLFNKIKNKYKKCKICDKYIEQNLIKQHSQNCKIYIIKCRFCKFKGEKKNFFEHYIKKHGDKLIEESEKIEKNSIQIDGGGNISGVTEFKNTLKLDYTNGFFYCYKPKDFNCNCCKDNICKKDNCMCSFCQKKNCEREELNKTTLINKYGNFSYFHLGKFICNMNFQNNTKYCDGIHNICPGCKSLFENRIHYLDEETYKNIQEIINFK